VDEEEDALQYAYRWLRGNEEACGELSAGCADGHSETWLGEARTSVGSKDGYFCTQSRKQMVQTHVWNTS